MFSAHPQESNSARWETRPPSCPTWSTSHQTQVQLMGGHHESLAQPHRLLMLPLPGMSTTHCSTGRKHHIFTASSEEETAKGSSLPRGLQLPQHVAQQPQIRSPAP